MEKEVSHLNNGKSKLNKLHSKLKLKLQKYFLEPPPPSRQTKLSTRPLGKILDPYMCMLLVNYCRRIPFFNRNRVHVYTWFCKLKLLKQNSAFVNALVSCWTLWSVKDSAQSLLSPCDAMFGRESYKAVLVHLSVMCLECLIYVHLFA